MNVIPRISSERLATLPAGTRIKFCDQVITLRGCSHGNVAYTEPDGTEKTTSDFVITNSATEDLTAVRCECCGRFLAPADVKRTLIQRYRTSEMITACADGLCTSVYQSRIKTPAKSKAWRSRW